MKFLPVANKFDVGLLNVSQRKEISRSSRKIFGPHGKLTEVDKRPPDCTEISRNLKEAHLTAWNVDGSVRKVS